MDEMMTSKFESEIKNGNIFRKRKCQRCGAETFEKFCGFQGNDWQEVEVYENSGFGTVVIVPWDITNMERTEIRLCPSCAEELKTLLKNFDSQMFD